MRTIPQRYELTTPIASSGMGTLWGGADRWLNRKVSGPPTDVLGQRIQATKTSWT